MKLSCIKDRDGSGYIRACIVLLLLMIVFSALMFFSEELKLVRSVREGMDNCLDSAVTLHTIETLEILNDSSADVPAGIYEKYTELMANFFPGLTYSGGTYTRYGQDGDFLWSLSDTKLTADPDGGRIYTLTCTFSTPVCFAGVKITDLEVVLKCTADYRTKE